MQTVIAVLVLGVAVGAFLRFGLTLPVMQVREPSPWNLLFAICMGLYAIKTVGHVPNFVSVVIAFLAALATAAFFVTLPRHELPH
ncbi:MAG: hypothetical protein H3C58_01510 [Fimbriimonadaceae bacterium]|nr:hypothetical protein [Fimbriimonadaceae bacterium]